MNKVFVVGSMNMDLIFNTNRIPESGETMHSDNFSILPGGKGANQAVACSMLGTKSYMIGNVGSDMFARMIREDLQNFGVNIDFVIEKAEVTSGVACIIVCNNDNRIILDHGANISTSSKTVHEALNKYGKENDVLLAQLEIPYETVFKSLLLAKNKGLKTILNPAPGYPLPQEIYQYVDVIVPNEIEAEMLTGLSSKSENFDEEAIKFFLKKGVKEVVITKGCKGSVYGDKKNLIYTEPYQVNVVDTTGAGDAFVGAIASGVAKGKMVKDSLEFATACSALAVTKFGAQKSMPSLQEVEKFLKESKGA